MPDKRYIGIIADGSTDKEIMSKLAKCLLESEGFPRSSLKEVFLGQVLGNDLNGFMSNSSKTNKYGLGDEPARKLKDAIILVLSAAIKEFQNEIKRELRHTDLLVLNTDSESYLSKSDDYFKEWALVISKIFFSAIEKFYHLKAQRGYQFENLPLIAPIILFPSTDILIAAARTRNVANFNYHNMSASNIKNSLYRTYDLRELPKDKFDEFALNYLTIEGCKAIYRHLPETRLFLRTLSWNIV